MTSVDIWPSSLPRIKFVFFMDFSPLKLYDPIVEALWHRVWRPVMQGCGCDYYPHTALPEYFFEGDERPYGQVGWDSKDRIYDYDNMD